MKNAAQTQTSEEELAVQLAEKTDVSPRQARELIRKYGDDREKLMKAAKGFKAES